MQDVQSMVAQAVSAANAAGKTWLDNATPRYSVHKADLITGAPIGPSQGTMLDMCGNAHVQFKDKRTAAYKAFVKADAVRRSGNAVVQIEHNYRYRQEHGLAYACAKAAKAKLEELGVTGLRIWDYID